MSALSTVGWIGSAAALALGVGAALRQPPPAPATSADRVPVIVELFTSEGCSSCPPADAVLSRLVEAQPVNGAMVIGLSEHVDYWDQLGWKNPFSSHRFTERQSGYAAKTSEPDIYTPQMVVDGSAAFVGSDQDNALAEVARAATHAKPVLRALWANGSPRSLIVNLPEGGVPSGATVWLAVVEDHLTSTVTRGENTGRRLPHTAVTRQLTTLGPVTKAGGFHSSARVDTPAEWKTEALHAVVFVQLEHYGRILAAASVPFGS